MTRTICVFLGSREGNDPDHAVKVRELGRWIGENGHRLIYGGSRIGLMGMLAESALEAGACVTGVEPRYFVENELQLEGLTELVVTEDMTDRNAAMMQWSDVFIAFPGGTGTLAEISEVMCALSLGLIKGICIIYNLNGYYDHLEAQLDHMTDEGLVLPEKRKKIHFCKTLEEIEKVIA